MGDQNLKPLLIAVGWIAITMPASLAQTSPQPPVQQSASAKALEFDVVSIKPNKAGSTSEAYHSELPLNRFFVENMSVKGMISIAYHMRSDLISGGPGWIDSKRYDVEAKVDNLDLPNSPRSNPKQHDSMVQRLLADRFKLVVHLETKESPVYELSVAKGSSKLQKSKPDEQESYGANFGDIDGESLSIATLANLISQQLNRTIVDKTGLTGRYDIKLKWASDLAPVDDSALNTAPGLSTALQEQLGLKLTSTKGPVQTLVIDRVALPSGD
jgi:uncharacterized protein (TIGR03435 family)